MFGENARRSAELDPQDRMARKRAELQAQREQAMLGAIYVVRARADIPIDIEASIEFPAPRERLNDQERSRLYQYLERVVELAVRHPSVSHSVDGCWHVPAPVFFLDADYWVFQSRLPWWHERRYEIGPRNLSARVTSLDAPVGKGEPKPTLVHHRWIAEPPSRVSCYPAFGRPYEIRQSGRASPLIRGGPAMLWGFDGAPIGDLGPSDFRALFVDRISGPEGLSLPCFDVRYLDQHPRPIKLVLTAWDPLKREPRMIYPLQP